MADQAHIRKGRRQENGQAGSPRREDGLAGIAPAVDLREMQTAHQADSVAQQLDGVRYPAIATCDHQTIQQWAARHEAQPALLDDAASGAAALKVRDGGTIVRFNFPAAGRFRPVSWEEWFEEFERRQLTFIYEEEVADRAYELWQSRGKTHGHDVDDWIEAEHQLDIPRNRPSARYRFIPPRQ